MTLQEIITSVCAVACTAIMYDIRSDIRALFRRTNELALRVAVLETHCTEKGNLPCIAIVKSSVTPS